MPITITQIQKKPGIIKKLTGNYISPELSDLKLILVPIKQDKTQKSEIYNTVAKRWISVDSKLKEWYVSQRKFNLGDINDIIVQTDVWVIMMIVYDKDGNLDEAAYKKALTEVSKVCTYNKASLHISNTLLEGNVEELLKECIIANGTNISIYTPQVKSK